MSEVALPELRRQRRITQARRHSLDYHDALTRLRTLPNHCATDLADLAELINVEELTLLRWLYADAKLAALVDSKAARDG